MVLVSIIIAGIIAYYIIQLTHTMQSAISLTQPVTVQVKPGDSVRTIAAQLVAQDVLDKPQYFILWGRLHNQSRHIQAGEYVLKNAETLAMLLEHMVNGEVVQHKITLIEGITFRQMLAQMEKNPFLVHTLSHTPTKTIMTRLGHPAQLPEGRFFPDTYDISVGMKDIDLLRRAYETMQRILTQEWQQREKNLPLKNAYQALILASIVEKETAVKEERPLIAGVFINRLNRKMRLQTDASVIYGIKNYDGNIRFKDLRKDTPYNTYTRYGLPPTPVAMPGRAAIHAVLHPDKTDKLYFVAYGDGSGRHFFSSNLTQHEKAVDKYQRRKRTRRRRTDRKRTDRK